MQFSQRTHTICQVNASLDKQIITLNGWVHRIRNQGSLIFINIRDRSGIAQCLVDEKADHSLKHLALSLHNEYCISLTGIVQKRPHNMINQKMVAGDVEIIIQRIEILNTSLTPPFTINEDQTSAKEELRLKYRYLDMRSGRMQRNLKMRHQIAMAVRKELDALDFYEIETPILIKSTPEGARDYVVPSRIYPHHFFALPQSPQIYKQILMIGGCDRYFQFARCFRDEDPRGDRQPEFTQIDIEMSFVQREDIFKVIENILTNVMKTTLQCNPNTPFKRFSYREAMNRFGSDKPDIRYALELQDASDFLKKSQAEFLHKTLTNTKKCAKLLHVPSYAKNMSRKTASTFEDIAKKYNLEHFMWMKINGTGFEGGAAKLFNESFSYLSSNHNLKDDDVVLIAAGTWENVCTVLGIIRTKLASELNIININELAFCWIVDFPLFQFDENINRWQPMHHMFSAPQKAFIENFEDNPQETLGELYDLVLNGYELASGSIRIHDRKVQERIFNLIGYSQKNAQSQFGFMLDALNYGAPPHGGIAIGLDRLIMIICQEENIREVIAYPKNTAGFAPLEEAPSLIETKQLNELYITLKSSEQ